MSGDIVIRVENLSLRGHETNSTNKTTCMNKKDRKSQEQTPKDNLYGMRENL